MESHEIPTSTLRSVPMLHTVESLSARHHWSSVPDATSTRSTNFHPSGVLRDAPSSSSSPFAGSPRPWIPSSRVDPVVLQNAQKWKRFGVPVERFAPDLLRSARQTAGSERADANMSQADHSVETASIREYKPLPSSNRGSLFPRSNESFSPLSQHQTHTHRSVNPSHHDWEEEFSAAMEDRQPCLLDSIPLLPHTSPGVAGPADRMMLPPVSSHPSMSTRPSDAMQEVDIRHETKRTPRDTPRDSDALVAFEQLSEMMATVAQDRRCGPPKPRNTATTLQNFFHRRKSRKQKSGKSKATSSGERESEERDIRNGEDEKEAAAHTTTAPKSSKRKRSTTRQAKTTADSDGLLPRKKAARAGAKTAAAVVTGATLLSTPITQPVRAHGSLPAETRIHYDTLTSHAEANKLFHSIKQALLDPDRIQAPPLFSGLLVRYQGQVYSNFTEAATLNNGELEWRRNPQKMLNFIDRFAFRWQDKVHMMVPEVGAPFLVRVLRELVGVEVITFNAPFLLIPLLLETGGALHTTCVSDIRVMGWMSGAYHPSVTQQFSQLYKMVMENGVSTATTSFACLGKPVQEFVNQIYYMAPLYRHLYAHLGSRGLLQPFLRQEKRVCLSIAQMKCNGMLVDVDAIRQLKEHCLSQMEAAKNRALELLPTMPDFNIQSADQCRYALYEHLQLGKYLLDKDVPSYHHHSASHFTTPHSAGSGAVLTKKNGKLSTAEEALRRLAPHHELPRVMIQYRKSAKILQNYIEGMMQTAVPWVATTVEKSDDGHEKPRLNDHDSLSRLDGPEGHTVTGGETALSTTPILSLYGVDDTTTMVPSGDSLLLSGAVSTSARRVRTPCVVLDDLRVRFAILHPNFLQEGTDTGRLSCTEPNLQNLPRGGSSALGGSAGKSVVPSLSESLLAGIPAAQARSVSLPAEHQHQGRDNGGRPVGEIPSGDGDEDVEEEEDDMEAAVAFRDCFVAPPGAVLVSIDYEQIELRLLAHLCGDVALIDALTNATDIHQRIAEKIFQKPHVTSEERNIAKRMVFGTLYGAGVKTMAAQLRLSLDRAAAIASLVQSSFPSIERYRRQLVEEARRQGFVRTLSGRLRFLPDLQSSVAAQKSYAERQAFNTVVQGSAADVMKLAMLAVQQAVLSKHPSADIRLLSQIHDELVFVIPFEKLELLVPQLTASMSTAASLRVPLPVVAKYGRSLGSLRVWTLENELGLGISS